METIDNSTSDTGVRFLCQYNIIKINNKLKIKQNIFICIKKHEIFISRTFKIIFFSKLSAFISYGFDDFSYGLKYCLYYRQSV